MIYTYTQNQLLYTLPKKDLESKSRYPITYVDFSLISVVVVIRSDVLPLGQMCSIYLFFSLLFFSGRDVTIQLYQNNQVKQECPKLSIL